MIIQFKLSEDNLKKILNIKPKLPQGKLIVTILVVALPFFTLYSISLLTLALFIEKPFIISAAVTTVTFYFLLFIRFKKLVNHRLSKKLGYHYTLKLSEQGLTISGIDKPIKLFMPWKDIIEFNKLENFYVIKNLLNICLYIPIDNMSQEEINYIEEKTEQYSSIKIKTLYLP